MAPRLPTNYRRHHNKQKQDYRPIITIQIVITNKNKTSKQTMHGITNSFRHFLNLLSTLFLLSLTMMLMTFMLMKMAMTAMMALMLITTMSITIMLMTMMSMTMMSMTVMSMTMMLITMMLMKMSIFCHNDNGGVRPLESICIGLWNGQRAGRLSAVFLYSVFLYFCISVVYSREVPSSKHGFIQILPLLFTKSCPLTELARPNCSFQT